MRARNHPSVPFFPQMLKRVLFSGELPENLKTAPAHETDGTPTQWSERPHLSAAAYVCIYINGYVFLKHDSDIICRHEVDWK